MITILRVFKPQNMLPVWLSAKLWLTVYKVDMCYSMHDGFKSYEWWKNIYIIDKVLLTVLWTKIAQKDNVIFCLF